MRFMASGIMLKTCHGAIFHVIRKKNPAGRHKHIVAGDRSDMPDPCIAALPLCGSDAFRQLPWLLCNSRNQRYANAFC